MDVNRVRLVTPERERLFSELATSGREYDATESDRRERPRNAGQSAPAPARRTRRAHPGRAQRFLTGSNARWDLISLDAERSDSVDYWPISSGRLDCLDCWSFGNVVSLADEFGDFRGLVDSSAKVASTVEPTGAGLVAA